MNFFISNCCNRYGGISVVDSSCRCHSILNRLIRQIIPAGFGSRGRTVAAVRRYIGSLSALPVGSCPRYTAAVIGILALISLLMGKHTFISAGVCIILFYGLLIIREIHAQVAGNGRIIILFCSQQYLLDLIGDHGFRLILQLLHRISDSCGRIIISTCKQQVGICIHNSDIRRSIVAQPGSHTFCQCRGIGGGKGAVQFQLDEGRRLFLLCCQSSVIFRETQMYLGGFYCALCFYRLCYVFFQIGIVKSLFVSGGRRHTTAQIIIPI